MHKVLLISGLTLTLAGCVASQEAPPPVQVQDLSSSRSADRPATYTVEAGDTLYGIAWRHDMDYRDLARLNRIEPPYRIQPGQQLSLGGSGSAGGGGDSDAAGGSTATSGGGAVATGLGTASQDDGSLDWLLPDGSTERGSGDESQAEAASAGSEDSDGEGVQSPGPVYDPDSPGADGNLSERDRAERREREQAASEASSPARSESSAETTAQDEAATSGDSEPEADAGTRVAGEPEADGSEQRRYTPVEEVPWQWPVDGEVVGAFGEGGSITAGIDIDGQKGQPVKAAGPGIVVYAGSGVRGYGNLILLKHNDEFLSAYAHNDSLRVKENDVVEVGEVIAGRQRRRGCQAALRGAQGRTASGPAGVSAQALKGRVAKPLVSAKQKNKMTTSDIDRFGPDTMPDTNHGVTIDEHA